MAWIESHTHTVRHRKLIEFARELRLKPIYLMGHLHALWHAALEQQEDGDLSSWSDALIADLSGFSADSARYVRLLQKHRWLGYFDETGTLVPGTEKIIHDWLDYAGMYLRGKYAKGNRPRLEAIWCKHRRIYGEGGKLAESQQLPNRNPTTPLPTYPPTHLPGKPAGAADVRSELIRAGVSSPKRRSKCLDVPGIFPVTVALLADEIRRQESVGDVGAVLSTRILEGGTFPHPTPELVYGLAKAGRVLSVCGHPALGVVMKYGTGKLYVGETCIPSSELNPEQIELVKDHNGSTN